MKILSAVLIVILAFVVFSLILSIVIFKLCFTRHIQTRDMATEDGVKLMKLEKFKNVIFSAIAKTKTFKSEDVRIQSYDGLSLQATLYENENADTTVILFHGWISNGMNDFGCAIPDFKKYGYNILLVSERGQGESAGKYICMGTQEKYDCVSWCDYIAQRFGNTHNIFIEGISMGASTVLLASALELPENVRGIIADCGFTSPAEIMKSVALKKYIIPYPTVWFIALWFLIFCKGNIYKDSTVEAMKTNKLPILFIHGERDNFVPCYMSKKNYDACTAEKKMVLIPEAGHGQAYLYNPKKCLNELAKFISAHKK